MVDHETLLEMTADDIFADCEDDVVCIAEALEDLDPAMRDELLVSDHLNAYQTFYYYFRQIPEELIQERLILQPASALGEGVLVEEIDLYELVFTVHQRGPLMAVSDGEALLETFEGPHAYTRARAYAEDLI
ncbi:hypothetical protein [Methanosphaerula palustris]|nr:hypothetical protein [Methanosphaerula palustris]